VTRAVINYVRRGTVRPYYYANGHARDHVPIDAQEMPLIDGRNRSTNLDVEGFALIPHISSATDFADAPNLPAETIELIQSLTGADHVVITAPGILRFSERSSRAGTLNNSMPARFAHIDVTTATARSFGAASAPRDTSFGRFAQFNIWRAISDPPQDVPLAVCDFRSVADADLVEADAIFDEAGKPEWSFASWVIAHNPAHRWHWFSDMTRDEALVFKTHDSDTDCAAHVPHVAFDNPDCPIDAPPRASIEMRATAYWF
jgi:hypothetical protein